MIVRVAGAPVTVGTLGPLMVGVRVATAPLNVVYSGARTSKVQFCVPVGRVG